jgi:hypothetical protein
MTVSFPFEQRTWRADGTPVKAVTPCCEIRDRTRAMSLHSAAEAMTTLVPIASGTHRSRTVTAVQCTGQWRHQRQV